MGFDTPDAHIWTRNIAPRWGGGAPSGFPTTKHSTTLWLPLIDELCCQFNRYAP